LEQRSGLSSGRLPKLSDTLVTWDDLATGRAAPRHVGRAAYRPATEAGTVIALRGGSLGSERPLPNMNACQTRGREPRR
jgi:hypothetical protein